MKLYYVNVTVEVDMAVLAESHEQAESVGKAHWMDEVMAAGIEADHSYAEEVVNRLQLGFLSEDDMAYGSPYGPGTQPQLSINEYLKQQGIT